MICEVTSVAHCHSFNHLWSMSLHDKIVQEIKFDYVLTTISVGQQAQHGTAPRLFVGAVRQSGRSLHHGFQLAIGHRPGRSIQAAVATGHDSVHAQQIGKGLQPLSHQPPMLHLS